MHDEFDALIKTGTWDLVPRPTGVNIVNCMWLFKHKYKSNGDLERHKSRLVCDGRSQEVGMDYDETFSPVVNPATIRTVLSLAMAKKWLIHHLDVKNAFLHGDLQETVYMHQPPGFVDRRAPSYGDDMAYLLLYVDDIILATSSNSLAGALQYLTFTRPDIAYAVQQVCLFMHVPRESHYDSLKRILRYVQGTIDHGLFLYLSTSTRLTTYTDADWEVAPTPVFPHRVIVVSCGQPCFLV
ncbi:uncharacterized protein LOC110713750 [Chenopodium quinoa]|uniref:uncharacterized protein LOC110713750 n=1 Tax=Chenopodium quinoa TaxID=63459 RepID=UPI000B772D90|nr:uncharacterized protein LOC110713750 [Chenopodium quinoa]